jgi:hypothetical protein
VVRIPSFARRSDAAAAEENRDGRIDEQAGQADPPVADTRSTQVGDQIDDRGPRHARHSAAAAAERWESAEAERTVVERPVDVAGPRPRASLLATLGLVFGVAAALLVLTGLLAGYGVAVGVLAVLLSIGGVSATRKRHVAGKSDALLGIVLGLGAIIVGGLALTGTLPWLTTETDKVADLRQWLDTQFSQRF